jgi:hypothetical protein
MGVSVWENHEDLELVGRAACQIPPPQVLGTKSRPQFASIRPPPSGCLAPPPSGCLAPNPDTQFASIRPPHSGCLAPI